jgi:Glycosyl hydrolase family 76
VPGSDIYEWATDGFDRFTSVWQFDDFWTRSNTFDACLRFVMAAQAKWPSDPKVEAMETFLRKRMIPANQPYFSFYLTQAMWADDYGWCGIASLTAHDYLLSVGDAPTAAAYLAIAGLCWKKMVTSGYDSTYAAQPVPHGCGNGNGTDPGTKNTVTNANLFVLSLRLYEVLRATPYLELCYGQYVWFSSWFDPQYDYLRTVDAGCGLVQERPIAKPDYEKKDRPTWEAGWVWTGDQGLLLGALAGTLQITDALKTVDPGFDPDAFQEKVTAWIGTIVTGARSLLFDASDNVLREPPFESSFDDDPQDYVCGRGVLLRYLSEAVVQPHLGNRFSTGIGATAEAVWNGRDPATNQFGADWNPANDSAFNQQFTKAWGNGDTEVSWRYGTNEDTPVNGILQAAGLDVLGAAIPILG